MLLELKQITKSFSLQKGLFKKQIVKAVERVDLSVAHQESLGIVGESGSGKTTLARMMLKLIEPDSGQIFFDQKDITAYSSRQMRPIRSKLQMVFQDPYSSLDPRLTVASIIQEAMFQNKRQPKQEKTKKTIELLEMVGLKGDVLSRFPHEFSGGERQRIAIARALAGHPQLLVLDEAVSSLDVLVQDQIVNLLIDLQKKFSLTYIFIAHNLRVVKKMCQRVAVMYQGKVVELGPIDKIFSSPQHPYTQELLDAAFKYSAFPRRDLLIDERARLKEVSLGHFVLTL